MKNIFFILIACLLGTMVNAAPAQTGSVSRRDLMIQFYAQQRSRAEMGEKFLTAVKKGDLQTISEMESRAQDGAYLLAVDKFGNNAFHLAKDASTLQVVARSIRKLYQNEFPAKIIDLKNQSNHSGAIPAVQTILDLNPGKFFILLENSSLQESIRRVKSISKGGALDVAASALADEVVKQLQIADGFTVVDFARAHEQVEGMDKVVSFFNENVPYL
ncbi:MAG: hypothetical protein ACI351_06415 [Candidatus Avelusimicrobium sp.]|uniref:hypothetical protein n=1 Tax=Candidatus Avelusimicrobium sp. TaxID=3048833 RepID=UPI003F0847B7